MLSSTEENYIKAIFSLELSSQKNVSTTFIANKMRTKASSVTDMVKKLAEKKLVLYQKYKGVSLTKKGRKAAVKIIRKHRLWEVFLVEKLNFNWDEVHEIAEQLEHIESDQLLERLDAFLNYPTKDPHGDPIPDKNGHIEHHENRWLSSIENGESCIVVGVKDSTDSFLKLLDKLNIQLGSSLKVVSKEPFDNSMLVETVLDSISISHQVSKNLFVKKS